MEASSSSAATPPRSTLCRRCRPAVSVERPDKLRHIFCLDATCSLSQTRPTSKMPMPGLQSVAAASPKQPLPAAALCLRPHPVTRTCSSISGLLRRRRLFLVSVVDSSFVPLPVPGVTDIMIVLFAARTTNWLLLVALATAGSALGGYLSYQVGQAGGMAFLERHVPPRIFKRVCGWMETPRHPLPSRCPRCCRRRCRSARLCWPPGCSRCRDQVPHHLHPQPLPAPLVAAWTRHLLRQARAASVERLLRQVGDHHPESSSGAALSSVAPSPSGSSTRPRAASASAPLGRRRTPKSPPERAAARLERRHLRPWCEPPLVVAGGQDNRRNPNHRRPQPKKDAASEDLRQRRDGERRPRSDIAGDHVA